MNEEILNLMERIIEVRYTDMEEEKQLCKQLLNLSESRQYQYGCAFANVYLVDSHLALGEYSSCDFYIMRASNLCRKYSFDSLMLMLCNYAGLYYQKLNEDQVALSYFLEGKKLAEQCRDISMLGKLYNNIGYAFGFREDWETARTYLGRAYEIIKPYLEDENIQSAVSYLTNLADACIHFKDFNGARQALLDCEALGEDSAYSRVRLGCSWCFYYTRNKEWELCKKVADQLLETNFFGIEDQFFIGDMAVELCSNMLDIGDQERVGRLLDLIYRSEYETSLSLQHRVKCLEIRYWEACGEEDKLDEAYKSYYEISQKIIEIEDKIYAQSMLSKIQINQETQEHMQILSKNQILEDASQLDELTGLYNRRYFNKLVSKITQRENVQTLGFIMSDVDSFKQYNDFYGHFKGDKALQIVAKTLAKCATEDIYVSRYGGDEFVCLCVNQEDKQIEAYMRKVSEELKQANIPNEKGLTSKVLRISMGCYNGVFHKEMDTERLLSLADQALYQVKADKKLMKSEKDWRKA